MYKLYEIINILNNSKYVGFTSLSIEKRFKAHILASKQSRYSSHLLYKAFKKYGIENFKCTESPDILIECKQEAWAREKFWISFYKSNRMQYPENKGYNMNDGGSGGSGYKHTQKSLEKMRKNNSNKKHTLETKQKISKSNKGKQTSEYAKIRASETHKGKKLSEEHKKILSVNCSNRNNNLTKEDRQKLSDNAPTARKINQYDLNENFLQQYKQIKHATKASNLTVYQITNACKGKWLSIGGFIWKYAK